MYIYIYTYVCIHIILYYIILIHNIWVVMLLCVDRCSLFSYFGFWQSLREDPRAYPPQLKIMKYIRFIESDFWGWGLGSCGPQEGGEGSNTGVG